MNFKKIYKKNDTVVSREIDEGTLLIPHKAGYGTGKIYKLNKTGCSIWGLIDGKRSVNEILDMLCQKYDASREELLCDIEDFIKAMTKIKAIK